MTEQLNDNNKSMNSMASLVAQTVKNLPSVQKTLQTWVQTLGLEESQEEAMATQSSTLPGESQGQRSLAGYRPWGHKESDTTE